LIHRKIPKIKDMRYLNMKKIAPIFSIAVLLATAPTSSQGQSLADMADKEKQRREEINETPDTITNDEISGYSGGSVSTTTPISPSSTEPDTKSAEGTEETSKNEEVVDPYEPTDFEGRTETYWRDIMTESRQKVKNLEQEAIVFTLRMNDLENKFFNIGDGFDRDSIQKEIQKTFYEIDLNKENLAKAKEELQDLENDARKSGALPGWID